MDIGAKNSLKEHLETGKPSAVLKYPIWKENKIVTGLEQTKDCSKMIPAHEVWEKLGIEY